MFVVVVYSSHYIKCAFFCGSGGIATIKHRCVTHLCGSNFILQDEAFLFKFIRHIHIGMLLTNALNSELIVQECDAKRLNAYSVARYIIAFFSLENDIVEYR